MNLNIERWHKRPSWADSFSGTEDWRYYACDNQSSAGHFVSYLQYWGWAGLLTGGSMWWRDGHVGRPVPALPTIGRITGKFLIAGAVFHGTESLLMASMGKHHWSQQAVGGALVGALFPVLAGMAGRRGIFFRSILTGVCSGAFMGGARGVTVQQEFYGHVLRAKARVKREEELRLHEEMLAAEAEAQAQGGLPLGAAGQAAALGSQQ